MHSISSKVDLCQLARIWDARVESGRIMRVFSNPDPDSKICGKPGLNPESLFIFGSSRSIFHFLKMFSNRHEVNGAQTPR